MRNPIRRNEPKARRKKVPRPRQNQREEGPGQAQESCQGRQGGPPEGLWGVFNQTLRRISLFEYNQRAEADKKAAELSESQKSPHFVQLVKEAIEE